MVSTSYRRVLGLGCIALVTFFTLTACEVTSTGAGSALPNTPTALAHVAHMVQVSTAKTVSDTGLTSGVTVTATCPTGAVLMSGGYAVTGPAAATAGLRASYPDTPNSWTVNMIAIGNGGAVINGPFTVTATANCLQNTIGIVSQVIANAPSVAGDNAVHSATADCPSGSVVTGGGFNYALGVVTNMPHANGWAINVITQLGAATTAHVYAVCAVGTLTGAATPSKVQAVPTSGSVSIAAACQTGQTLVGGGFDLNGVPVNSFADSAASDFSAWADQMAVPGEVGPGAPRNGTVFAVCVTITGL